MRSASARAGSCCAPIGAARIRSAVMNAGQRRMVPSIVTLLTPRALPGPRDVLNLLALHVLLEKPEERGLARRQHFVDGTSRAPLLAVVRGLHLVELPGERH